MKRCETAFTTLIALLALCPAAAWAEVMDKEVVPWDPDRIVWTLGVATLCGVLPLIAGVLKPFRVGWWLCMVMAMGLAVLWGVLTLAFDDFYDFSVGPAIRHELGEAQSRAYEVMLILEGFLPATAAVLATLFANGRGRPPSPAPGARA